MLYLVECWGQQPLFMDARPQVERGTAGLKLSVTAKPYNYEIEHLNPLPLSASPAPAPADLANKPPVALGASNTASAG